MTQGEQINHHGFNIQNNQHTTHNYYAPQPAREVSWPVVVHPIPAKPTAFQPRGTLLTRISAARVDGGVVLLGGGGVGKSQLAAAHARTACAAGDGLVLWIDAARPDTVVSAFAQAALRVGALEAQGADPAADARALLEWLTATDRPWLVVFDDVTDFTGIEQWWPTGRAESGWALATTRYPDAKLSGGGRQVIDVDVFTPDESASYLGDRFKAANAAHLLDPGAAELAAEVGHLPLALAHAAAFMINEAAGCTPYLKLFADERARLAELMPQDSDTEGYGRPVDIALLLALDAAQAADPPGLAVPALRLAALFDPAGCPEKVWKSEAVVEYLAPHATRVARAGGRRTRADVASPCGQGEGRRRRRGSPRGSMPSGRAKRCACCIGTV